VTYGSEASFQVPTRKAFPTIVFQTCPSTCHCNLDTVWPLWSMPLTNGSGHTLAV